MEDPVIGRLKSEAKGVEREATALVDQIGRVPDTMAPLADYVVNEAVAGLGAAVTEGLFGVRRPGSRVGRVLVQQQRANARRQLEDARKKQAAALAARLESAVQSLPDSVGIRFKGSLLNELAEARRGQRAASVARRVAGVAERLAAYEPPSQPQNVPGVEYTQLRDLEQTLRATIVGALSRLGANWWKERVPEDVRLNAERRLQENASPWPWHAGDRAHPISFVDFPDYVKTVTRRDNWRDAFQSVFGDVESVRTKLRELEPIRNDIAHSRDLTSIQKEKLRLYSRELLQTMRRKR